jgi:hypothetical protein
MSEALTSLGLAQRPSEGHLSFSGEVCRYSGQHLRWSSFCQHPWHLDASLLPVSWLDRWSLESLRE